MRKYAIIHYANLQEVHIQLIRATGCNTTRESIARSHPNYEPEMCIVEWEDTIAQQIPEAVAAIQEIIDAGVTIMTEAEIKAYLSTEGNPFYYVPDLDVEEMSSSSSIDSSSSSSWRGSTSSSPLD
jgi:hypothetical protein